MRNYTFLSMFRKYVNSSLILIIVTIVAMIVANSGWGDAYLPCGRSRSASLSVTSICSATVKKASA